MRPERGQGPCTPPHGQAGCAAGASHWAGEDSHNLHDLKTLKRPLTLPPYQAKWAMKSPTCPAFPRTLALLSASSTG